MILFIQKNWMALTTLAFSAGAFFTIVKLLINDVKHLEKDYYEFKEDLIDRLARIETALNIELKK